MFRAFFTFDAPAAIVLTTEARSGFFSGNVSILSAFLDLGRVRLGYSGIRIYSGIYSGYSAPRSRIAGMEIHLFRNKNSSQTNAYSHYSNYSYSGLIPNERALKINFPAKERVPWERACTVYTHPQDHLRFQCGGGAVYSDSLVIIGREMIDDLPDPGPIEENKILAKMARVTRIARMARTVAHMARWLADLADPL